MQKVYMIFNLTIVIATRNRPEMVKRCLETIHKQNYDGLETIVVDASSNYDTRNIILDNFPNVKYLYLANGNNKRNLSKNMGIENAKGNIIAFLDDDSIIQEGWLGACLDSYHNVGIGGAGGIIIDINAPKEIYGTNEIGKIAFDGTRIGNFDKDPGKVIEVDHLRGCNMSFRKDVLEKISGFDLNYTGSNVLEETDLSIRVKKAGFKILFNPAMKVIHTSAPREIVFREVFTLRREFYIARNSTYFMLVNFGFVRTFAYMLTNDTGIMAFFKKPSLRSFLCIWVSLFGKAIGFLVGISEIVKRMIGKK